MLEIDQQQRRDRLAAAPVEVKALRMPHTNLWLTGPACHSCARRTLGPAAAVQRHRGPGGRDRTAGNHNHTHRQGGGSRLRTNRHAGGHDDTKQCVRQACAPTSNLISQLVHLDHGNTPAAEPGAPIAAAQP